jgi:predicted RNA-binding Zn-ribbon protein involved in translation (DUF1610 family)
MKMENKQDERNDNIIELDCPSCGEKLVKNIAGVEKGTKYTIYCEKCGMHMTCRK